MKTLITLIAAACLVGTAFAQQPNLPSTPSPEQKKLEIWVGDWTYEAIAQASPLGPAGKIVGKNTTRPILGGLFVEFRGEDKGPTGTTQWTETDGYDPLNQRYIWKGFASDGSFNDVSYTIEGTKVTHSGTVCTGGKTYRIRGTIVFTPDFSSNTEQREFSVDGKTWKPLWECRATKIPFAASDETAVRQEVTQVMQDYTAACEHVDFATALRFVADVPEFRYADVDGKQYDYAGFKKLVAEFFAGFSSQKATTRNQDILVLGPDTVLVIWHGAIDLTQKDGSGLRSNDYNATFLFKRLGGTWKVVFQHESCLPLQPVPPQPAKPAEAPTSLEVK